MSSLQTQLVKKTAIIESGDFNLSAPRYLEKIEINSIFDFVTIGEACNIINGSTPKKDNNLFWDNGSIPWFTIDDIRKQGYKINETSKYTTKFALDNTSLKLIPRNTTLICCTASVGVCAYNEIELTTNQQFNALIINEDYQSKLDSKFLFWISTNLKDELLRLSGKTSFDFISGKNLKKISIPLPPLEIQEQIVKEIEGYQQIIDGCRQVVENYKPLIDIDPSWERYSFGQLIDDNVIVFRNGSAISDVLKDGIPYIKVSDMNHAQNIPEIETSKNFVDVDFSKEKIVKIGATIFPKVGQAINTDKKRITKVDCFVDGNTAIVEIIDEQILDNYFFFYIFNSIPLNSLCHDTGGYPSINKAGFRRAEICIPSIDNQKEIVEKLEQEREIIEGNKELIKIYEKKINDKIKELF